MLKVPSNRGEITRMLTPIRAARMEHALAGMQTFLEMVYATQFRVGFVWRNVEGKNLPLMVFPFLQATLRIFTNSRSSKRRPSAKMAEFAARLCRKESVLGVEGGNILVLLTLPSSPQAIRICHCCAGTQSYLSVCRARHAAKVHCAAGEVAAGQVVRYPELRMFRIFYSNDKIV